MVEQGRQTGRRTGKSAAAFRTISEVAATLEIQQHVLRFWETKFSQIKPLKRGGGRRYYRPEDVALLQRIRALLYDDGYTIRGVQRLLRDGGAKALIAEAQTAGDEAGPEHTVAQATPGPARVMPKSPPREPPEPTPLEAAVAARAPGNGAADMTLPPAVRAELEALRNELRLLKKELDAVSR